MNHPQVLVPMLGAATFTCGVLAGLGLGRSSCSLPPEDFTEADLTGTWVANGPHQTDTLEIREDGLYRQIVSAPVLGIDYESDWQPWSVEYRADGVPYLHLEGMSLCGWAPGEVPCTAAGAAESWWYDGCDGHTFQMPSGEVLLMITGVPEQFVQPPRGFKLLLPGGHESSWFFELSE